MTKFPTASFKLTSVKPSKVKNEVVVKGGALVKVDRTKWGLKYGSGNFFKELAGDKIINDEFELNLKLVAKK